MKSILLAASAALMIAVPGLGVAQDDHHHEGGGRSGGVPPAPHAVASPPARPAGPPPGAPAYHPQGQAFPGGQGGYRPQGGPVFPGGQGGYRPQAGQPGYRPQGFAGGYRGGPMRSGGQGFAYGNRQYFRYHAEPYRFPGGYYGWANHAWRQGEWLPPVFITSSYFINDWYDFGLWQPDYGYEWIRIGADAVLVNLADGQVVDAVPGVYYY